MEQKLSELRAKLVARLGEGRMQWADKALEAIGACGREVPAMARAVGEISVEEADAALIKLFTEKLGYTYEPTKK